MSILRQFLTKLVSYKFGLQQFRIVFVLVLVYLPTLGFGLSFPLPKPGNSIVGEVQTTLVKEGEDFSEIAERYDIGYYELLEANPGVDPDVPPKDTVLIVPTQYLLSAELNNNIIINLAEMRLYYVPKGQQRVYIFPVGIGKEDWNTPLGSMSIIEKIKNPRWVVPEAIFKFKMAMGEKIPRIMPPGPDNPLGNHALRLSLSDYLIHGTNVAAGVGRRSSAGCIRLYANDVEQLFGMVSVGTKVIIINQPYKVGWQDGKLYFEAHLPLLEQRLDMGDDMRPAMQVIEDANKAAMLSINWQRVKSIASDHLGIPLRIDG